MQEYNFFLRLYTMLTLYPLSSIFFYPFFGLVDVGCGENKGNVASVECLLLGWLGMNVGVHLYCVASLGFGEYGIEESRPDSLSK